MSTRAKSDAAIVAMRVGIVGVQPSHGGAADMVVATEIQWPGRREPCPAAPVIAGELRRRGMRVQEGIIRAGDLATAAENAAATARAWPDEGAPPDGAPTIGIGHRLHGPAARTAHAARRAAATACRARTILLASPRSFCAGVERAIETVERALERFGAPLFVRRQIVHNVHVVEDLARRGVRFVDDLAQVPPGAPVVFSAHGVSPAVRAEAARRRLHVIDATCPLVAKVHAEARRFAARGDTIVLIGRRDHEEVEGTFGEAPQATVVVETPADVAALEPVDPARVSYLTQTTLAVDETAEVIATLRARFGSARGPSSPDICYAATNRQRALREVSTDADVVLVVGSANSANSRHLVELAQRQGTAAYLIDGPEDIRLEWLPQARVIGLTAGASAPPTVVDDVLAALGGLGPLTVEERVSEVETARFRVAPMSRPS